MTFVSHDLRGEILQDVRWCATQKLVCSYKKRQTKTTRNSMYRSIGDRFINYQVKRIPFWSHPQVVAGWAANHWDLEFDSGLRCGHWGLFGTTVSIIVHLIAVLTSSPLGSLSSIVAFEVKLKALSNIALGPMQSRVSGLCLTWVLGPRFQLTTHDAWFEDDECGIFSFRVATKIWICFIDMFFFRCIFKIHFLRAFISDYLKLQL